MNFPRFNLCHQSDLDEARRLATDKEEMSELLNLPLLLRLAAAAAAALRLLLLLPPPLPLLLHPTSNATAVIWIS